MKNEKSNFHDLSIDEAINIAIKAVRHATARDAYSGGYINVLQVNESGVHHLKRINARLMELNI
jgi:20S proteasome alpha/beta subunit